MDKVSFYATVIFFIIILGPLSRAIRQVYSFISNCILFSKRTMILGDELLKLSQKEFEKWCDEFLLGNDFEKDTENGVWKKNGESYYVKCIRCKDINDKKNIVGVDAVKEAVGEMAASNLKCGIIITTGSLSNNAVRFIDTLPEGMSLKYFEKEYFNIELYSLDYVPVIN